MEVPLDPALAERRSAPVRTLRTTVTVMTARWRRRASPVCYRMAIEPVVITRAGHEPVVIVSKRDYDSLMETAYLLRNPANARRLLASIAELDGGGGTVRELVDE